MRGERSNPVRTHSKQPRLWGPCIADTTRNCSSPFGQTSSPLVKSAISGRFHWVFITLTWTGRDTGRPGFQRAVYKPSIQVGVYKSEVSSRTQVDSGCRRKSTFFGVAWRSPGQSGEITDLFTGFLRVKDYVLRRTFRTWVGCQLVRPVRVEIPRRDRQWAMD